MGQPGLKTQQSMSKKIDKMQKELNQMKDKSNPQKSAARQMSQVQNII